MDINYTKQSGFTIIELIIVLGIVAVLATLAIPSYRSYMVNSRQQEAKADTLKIAGELEQWRSRSLSYAGFIPKSVTTVTGFTYPITSQSGRYQISVYSFSKKPSGPGYDLSAINTASIGKNWLSVVTPTSDTNLKSYLMTSNGLKCSTTQKSHLDFSKLSGLLVNRNCGTFSGDWK